MADTPKKTEQKAGLRQSNAAMWSGIRDLILEARRTVVRGVNAALVWTNFGVGAGSWYMDGAGGLGRIMQKRL